MDGDAERLRRNRRAQRGILLKSVEDLDGGDASHDSSGHAMMCVFGAEAIATRALAHRSPVGAVRQNTHASVVVSVANGPPSVAL